jgi:hypothetical protein
LKKRTEKVQSKLKDPEYLAFPGESTSLCWGNKNRYYRHISRLEAQEIWDKNPTLLIFDVCRKISLWLEETYGVNRAYNNAVYKWIRDLAPYEPHQTNKPR